MFSRRLNIPYHSLISRTFELCQHRGFTPQFSRLVIGMDKFFRTVSSPTGEGIHDVDGHTARAKFVAEEKGKFLKMTVSEKRKLYACKNGYVTLDKVPTWTEYKNQHKSRIERIVKKGKPLFSVNENLSEKVSIWRGDITTLEIDAIGNAANSSLMGGGGVDGCIHRAAGPALKKECSILEGCQTGDAKITSGYKLPAKYVIHTVGPMGENRQKLESCYKTCLNILKEDGLRTLAMPCVSTGIFGYPNDRAGSVVLTTVRKWLDDHGDSVDRIIFCLFLQEDVRVYESLLPLHFPSNDDPWFIQEEKDVRDEKSPKPKIPKRNGDESKREKESTEEGNHDVRSKEKEETRVSPQDGSSVDVTNEDNSVLTTDVKSDSTSKDVQTDIQTDNTQTDVQTDNTPTDVQADSTSTDVQTDSTSTDEQSDRTSAAMQMDSTSTDVQTDSTPTDVQTDSTSTTTQMDSTSTDVQTDDTPTDGQTGSTSTDVKKDDTSTDVRKDSISTAM